MIYQFLPYRDTSLFTVITPTTRKATGSHVVRHRLQDEIQMEVDRHHQNEEQPDLQRTQRGNLIYCLQLKV